MVAGQKWVLPGTPYLLAVTLAIIEPIVQIAIVGKLKARMEDGASRMAAKREWKVENGEGERQFDAILNPLFSILAGRPQKR